MSNSLAAGSSSSTLGIVLPGVESGSLAAGTSSIERPAIALQYLGSSPPPFNPTRYDEHSLPARSFKTWLQLLKSLFPSLTPDTRAEIIVKKVGSAPEGYPELAEFLDFDNGLSVYRRFGWLHSRVLLQKQADISRIERYLRSSDTMNEGDKSRPNTMSDGRGKLKQDRNKLLAKAEEMLTQYDQFLLQAQELTQMESPSTRQYGNVLSFLWNHTPVVEADRENFFHRDDVITLRRGQPAPFLEMCFEKFFHRASVSSQGVGDRDRYGVHSPHYLTRPLVTGTFVLSTIILLLLPTMPLSYLTRDGLFRNSASMAPACVALIVAFALCFSGILIVCTRTRKHQVFLYAAAYSTFELIVFGILVFRGTRYIE